MIVGKAIGKAIERSPVTSATPVLSDAPQNQEELESEFRGVATSRGENVVKKSAHFCLELASNPKGPWLCTLLHGRGCYNVCFSLPPTLCLVAVYTNTPFGCLQFNHFDSQLSPILFVTDFSYSRLPAKHSDYHTCVVPMYC